MQFYDFLLHRIELSAHSTEDVLSSFLPLVREVLEAHREELVAPLEGLNNLHVEGTRIWFEQARCKPITRKLNELARIESFYHGQLEIMDESCRTAETGNSHEEVEYVEVQSRGQPMSRPVFLPGYVAWEHEIDHHDPLTDIFSLGMILASLACGLDFNDPKDLTRFATSRRNLFALNPQLDPAIAQAILKMTELNRRRRDQDLSAILVSLENYRDQSLTLETDLARLPGLQSRDARTKSQIVLSKLRDRLFDVSRRNSLLHFKPTLATVNLTQASIPLMLDLRAIREDQIFIWGEKLHRGLVEGASISLNKVLNFSEALYLPSLFERILADSRRDQQEFGFAQLRLVICFLSWANLKVKPAEKYYSPLVLVAVKLSKTKGVRDTYHIESLSSQAEINPVVRHQFRQLYDIDLPETIDLETNGLESLFEFLNVRVRASEPGVILERIDRPRIDVIHEKARRRLDQYRRKARVSGRGVRTLFDLDYSYDPVTFHPLGIKLFLAKVCPPETGLTRIVRENPAPRAFAVPEPPAESAERERSFFSIREAREENPYLWNFDLCSLTLANFRYRRMSLVRDFESILADERTNPAFDATFSLEARPVREETPPSLPLSERFDVVRCDPTQAMAIAVARQGESYIIQGPPGTGKSQTITNLIADFVARGKRVLFVCEKRAAIDVVFARLRQRGLASLSCLIHDSQTDKKDFVQDLKRTYEGMLEASNDILQKNVRTKSLQTLEGQLAPLEELQSRMLDHDTLRGLSLRQFLDRAVQLLPHEPEVTEEEKECLPRYEEWWLDRDRIAAIEPLVRDLQPDGILSRHPMRLVTPKLNDCEHPLEHIRATVPGARERLRKLAALLEKPEWKDLGIGSIRRLREVREYSRRVEPLAKGENLEFFDKQSDRWKQFQKYLRTVRARAATLDAARELNHHWRTKLPPGELSIALVQAKKFERNPLAFLTPGWWRLRSVLNRHYEFQRHEVRPGWVQLLTTLEREYDAAADYELASGEAMNELRLEAPPNDVVDLIANLESWIKQQGEIVRELHDRWRHSPEGSSLVLLLRSAESWLAELDSSLGEILVDFEDLPWNELDAMLDKISSSKSEIPRVLHLLTEIGKLPPGIGRTLRHRPYSIPQAEAAIARRTWEEITRGDRELRATQHKTRARRLDRAEESYDAWLLENSAEICRRVRERFLEHVYLSNASVSQIAAEQRDFKKGYTQGRRILEHEFGKSMRYRAIRELVDGDSGSVVRDLKRVWLMSPLSVSDTLPLESDFVDVVIFDEASQVPLEESVPSLFRGKQVIVVGDEMQLPPTDFFASKQSDELDFEVQDGDGAVRIDLHSDSLLNHASKNLASTLLGWHYRSRSESLISFSNWAFYEGRLLTVPDERLPPSDVSVTEPCELLLSRPVSFHFVEAAVYENRRNHAEADYVARLVRDLLEKRAGLSIGVVAFSEAQQDEIEAAIERLAQSDSSFRQLYDEELVREVDGQFIGLLVKNLENIQGDERDVMILSICYGPNAGGKMLMNFGPINQSGGEKRLNVAFSRAKQFMAVVSSIHSPQITNDYNYGASCLKSYLQYSESMSHGDIASASRVLAGFAPPARRREISEPEGDAVVAQIADALESRGFTVTRGIGHSHFRVDLAVESRDRTRYQLGILVDSFLKYQKSGVIERELMRPRLLREFGWNVATVLAKDWYDSRESELDRILAMLE